MINEINLPRTQSEITKLTRRLQGKVHVSLNLIQTHTNTPVYEPIDQSWFLTDIHVQPSLQIGQQHVNEKLCYQCCHNHTPPLTLGHA